MVYHIVITLTVRTSTIAYRPIYKYCFRIIRDATIKLLTRANPINLLAQINPVHSLFMCNKIACSIKNIYRQ